MAGQEQGGDAAWGWCFDALRHHVRDQVVCLTPFAMRG